MVELTVTLTVTDPPAKSEPADGETARSPGGLTVAVFYPGA